MEVVSAQELAARYSSLNPRFGDTCNDLAQMLVSLLTCFENAFTVVDAAWVALKTQQDLPRSCRAVDTGTQQISLG